MIHGRVADGFASVPVQFRLPNQPDILLDFVVDTGFSGFLALPQAAVSAMGLAYAFHTTVTLADETEAHLPVHSATVLWEGVEREVRVLAVGKRAALGTSLLDQYEITALFREGGPVSIDDLQIT